MSGYRSNPKFFCNSIDEHAVVRRIGDAIATRTTTAELCHDLVAAFKEITGCRHTAIYSGLIGAPFHLQAQSENVGAANVFPEKLTDSRVARLIAARHSPIQLDSATLQSSINIEWSFPHELESWLFIPLLEGSHLRGVLCLADDRPNGFSEAAVRSMSAVTPQIAMALANISLRASVAASIAKYRTLIDSMHGVVFTCDRDWSIESVNAAARELFEESIDGRVLTDLFLSATTVQRFLNKMNSDGIIRNFEVELRTANASKLTVLLSCVTHEDGYSGVIQDVTERAQLMDQVIRAQKMESVGMLAAGMAHDFNNVLSIILPNAQMIQLRSPQDLAVLEHAEVIVAASNRASKLTRQLLSLARKAPSEVRAVNLNDSIRDICGMLDHTIGKEISIEFRFESEPNFVEANDSELEQILLNLAINARDAMPQGGTLTFETLREGNEISLRIMDTGTGIQKEVLSNIFDPFFTTKDKSRGSGLGLSVVHSLIQRIGGSIEVQSEMGCGTEFHLRFPAFVGQIEASQLQWQPLPSNLESMQLVDSGRP